MIDVINLRKNFGEVEVLKGIDITINKGDIVAIVGVSGSGKSTFLRCLNCMEDPTAGSIIFNGVDIADMKVDINVHRRHIGMVFQHFNLFNNKTVLQNIMLAPVHVKCQDLKKARKYNRKNIQNRMFLQAIIVKLSYKPCIFCFLQDFCKILLYILQDFFFRHIPPQGLQLGKK